MHSSDQVNLNLTSQVGAHCMKTKWEWACIHGWDKLKVTCTQVIKFDLNLTWQVGARCMLIMDEIKSKVNIHPRDQVNLKVTWQIEAHCMLLIAWDQIGRKHACVKFESNLT